MGCSTKCSIQGMYKSGSILTIQGHPEFDEKIMTEILQTRHKQGIFGDDMFRRGMSRANDRHDGLLVSAAIWRFILEIDPPVATKRNNV